MSIRASIEHYIDEQYRQPGGIIGHFIGERMARQHAPETLWTVEILGVQANDHILEIGFGAGKGLELLAGRASQGHVVGLDPSRAMLRSASRRNRSAIRAGRVTLYRGEASKLPLADQSFDKVMGIHTLYFWPDPPRAFAEIQRVLKPGGTLTLTFLPRDRWPGGTGTERCRVYSPEDVMHLMKQAGFSETHVERGPRPERFRELAVVGYR